MRIHVILMILITVGCLACSDLSTSSYGVAALKSPGGEELFFRYEARGLSYEQLVLSEEKNYCSEPNPATEVIFQGEGLPLYYKFEGESLHLFLTTPAKVPKNFSGKVEIIQHVLNNLDFVALKNTYKTEGLVYLDKLFDENLKCK